MEKEEKYYFYVLKSKVDGSFYRGHTDELQQRLKIHNWGKVQSTK